MLAQKIRTVGFDVDRDLQRIAVVYLFASAITLWTGARGRLLWIIGLLVGYYAVMRFTPVPGCDPAANWRALGSSSGTAAESPVLWRVVGEVTTPV